MGQILPGLSEDEQRGDNQSFGCRGHGSLINCDGRHATDASMPQVWAEGLRHTKVLSETS